MPKMLQNKPFTEIETTVIVLMMILLTALTIAILWVKILTKEEKHSHNVPEHEKTEHI